MDVEPTPDQRAIARTFRDLFARESSSERVRAAEATEFDGGLWRLLGELGAIGITVPEAAGGSGAGALELALVAEEMGRRVAPVPLVEGAIAAEVVAASPASASLVGPILSGDVVATFAPRPATEGVARMTPAGSVAEIVVALDGDELVAVESAAAPPAAKLGGLAVADRPLAAAATRHVLATGAGASLAFVRAGTRWRLATAAVLCGVAAEALAIGVDYVRQRRQFDAPIGSFQAVQHGLADIATATEGIALLVRRAAWAADAGRPEWSRLSAMAFALAAENAERAALASLHYHGGYGFTLEYDIHRYLRRAKGLALLPGSLDAAWRSIGAGELAPAAS